MTENRQGRIITFYSYKGGTGRSMALANIAWILASNRKRVLVLDWDLEAPGLQRYFRPFLIDRELSSSLGVVDLITDFILAAITPPDPKKNPDPLWYRSLTNLEPYTISLEWKFPKGGLIDFVPAGRQGPDYAMRFAAIHWQKFYDVLGGGAFIEELKERMRADYDYILVDSRTGVSDTSGICTIQMPDTLVICFTFNNQSIEGAASIAQGVLEQRTSQDYKSTLSSDRSKKSGSSNPTAFYRSPHRFRVFPVPMRVDQAEQEKLELRKIYSRFKFDPFLERVPPGDRKTYWGEVEVPYVPYFAYEEILAPFKEDPSDPKTCLAAFVRIAKEITQRDVSGFESLISPEEKQRILQEFATLPPAVLGHAEHPTVVTAAVPTTGSTASATLAAGESPLEKAIRRAEATLQSLDQEEREQARLFWMRLVRVPGPGENIENSKVKVHLSELGVATSPIIEKFAAADLVIVSHDDQSGEPTVEVTNEELLRSWPTLAKWITADRELMVWRQDLQASKARWEQDGKSEAYLLYGRPLIEATAWYETHRDYLSDKEADYIEASLTFQSNWQRRERRSRLWRGLAGMAVLLAIVVGLFFLFNRTNKSDKADQVATTAQQQIDAALQGSTESANQLQLGLLLATEALKIAPSQKAETILKNNLERLPRRIATIDLGNNVLGLAITGDGKQLASVTGRSPTTRGQLEDRAVQLHEVSTGRVLIRTPFLKNSRNFQLSPDGRYLAVAVAQNDNYEVNVLQIANGTLVSTILHRGDVYDMKFSANGFYLATGSADRTARLLDLRTGTLKPPLTLSGPASAVAFSADSKSLAVADDSFLIQVWEIPEKTSWSKSRPIQGESSALAIALSPPGGNLATVSYNNEVVRVWQVSTGKLVSSYQRTYGITRLSFTNDGKFLITGGDNGTIEAINFAGGKDDKIMVYEGDAELLSFENAGRLVGVAGTDAIARIWFYNGDSLSFERKATIIHKLNFTNLTFSSFNLVVTSSADNRATAWMLGVELTSDLQYETCARLTRNLYLDEWNTYLSSSAGAYRRTCSDLP